MSEKNKTLVLLDAHAIIHRAYHALPEFLSSQGEPTGALYGLASMLMKIITDLKPDYIIACYDLPQKTFRHQAYEAYKAGRAKAEESLISQIKNSRKLFDAFAIPIYDAPGYEADDVLGTITELAPKNLNIIIASGDMDTMQLIKDKRIQVYTLKKGINDTILYDEEKMKQRFGFAPELLADYKGLRGDPSDNIIGVKGIGEKTATSLVLKFGSIENIYSALKKGEEKSFKQIGLTERIINLLRENEEEAVFSKTLAQIRKDVPLNFSLPAKTFWQNLDLQKVEDVFHLFEFRSLFARLKNFFEQNSPKDHLVHHSPPLPEEEGDLLEECSVMLWLLNSDKTVPDKEEILHFTRTDSLEKAQAVLSEKLKEKKLDKIFEEIEKPIIPLVKKMQNRGILIDLKYFENLTKEYQKELQKRATSIYKLAGTEFNINSPKQLSEVLFGKMALKNRRKKGASGSFSTRSEVLEELALENPIAKEILAYRELQKLLSTYLEVIPQKISTDGRLHARFLQNGTTTGRFSSQEPNLQNLPIKSELGKKIRAGFIAAPNFKLISFDYSQIELRVAAILSVDKKMEQIFSQKKDIHAGVASFVFGVPIDQINAEMRRQAKVINFGIIYGMGITALQKSLGTSREEAQKFYDNYFRQFSGLADYLAEVRKFVQKNYYTETLFGRRRFFPNINSKIPFLKSLTERMAINAPVQGTAADLIKLAIRFVQEDLSKEKLEDKVYLVLQIHDELVYEVDETVLSKAQEIIQKAMQEVLERSYLKLDSNIPLLVQFSQGSNLAEVK